jgi:hypothetical protein
LLHSCRHAFIFVMMYCFRFRSASRKHPLSFESILDSNSNPNLHRSLSKIIAFHFWTNIVGFKIWFKFDFDSKPYFEKKLRKALFLKSLWFTFWIEFQNYLDSKFWKLDFQNDLNSISKFSKPCFGLFYLFFDLKPLV